MKFAFFADVHLSKYSQDPIIDNLPERLYYIKKVLYDIAKYCIENEIRVIIIGGDLLHGKSIIYAIAQEVMLQYFNDFKGELAFYVIDGNHDLSGKGEDVVSALRSLENVDCVKWVKFDQTYRFQSEDVFLVPYSTNMVNIIKTNRARILISHFGLSEGVLNSGMSVVSEISLKDLRNKYELVLLGHYHKPQEIIEQGLSVYYSGSVIQLDWGEKNDNKRFLVVDTNTLNVQSIPITGYKKHIEVIITNNNKDEALKEAQAAYESGDHVKVIMKEKVDLSNVSKDFNIIDKSEVDVTDRGITSSMSIQDKLKKYLEINSIPIEKHDEYMRVGLEIIQSCEGDND